MPDLSVGAPHCDFVNAGPWLILRIGIGQQPPLPVLRSHRQVQELVHGRRAERGIPLKDPKHALRPSDTPVRIDLPASDLRHALRFFEQTLDSLMPLLEALLRGDVAEVDGESIGRRVARDVEPYSEAIMDGLKPGNFFFRDGLPE